MKLECFIPIVFTLCCCPTYAQRHGRADSVQNYNYASLGDPILNFDYRTTRQWRYYRLSTILKMPRARAIATGERNSVPDVYEGVNLSQLVPALQMSKIVALKGSWGFRDKEVVSSDSLERGAEVLIADRINGRRFERSNPFSLVATLKGGQQIVIRQLSFIRVQPN